MQGDALATHDELAHPVDYPRRHNVILRVARHLDPVDTGVGPVGRDGRREDFREQVATARRELGEDHRVERGRSARPSAEVNGAELIGGSHDDVAG